MLTRRGAAGMHDGGRNIAEAGPPRQFAQACRAAIADAAELRHFDGDKPILFRPDQDQAQRSNRLPGDFSRRLIGSAVLRSRRDNA
jgi:hypothetical protein